MPAIAEISTAAMSAMAKVLHDAGCLSEPTPPAPAMSLDEAAQVVIRRARTPRLEADDPADVQLVVERLHLFEFARESARRQGIDPADTDLHTALGLLAQHHGLR